MNRPLEIGITGGIGTGKSTICRVFAALGVPVYDADQAAKRLMNENPDLQEAIKNNFGAESYQNEKLNSRYLAAQVFGREEKTALLNSLVHPAVKKDYQTWVLKHSHQPYILKEAALLVEAGSYKELDFLLVVSSPLELRIKRIQQRDPQRSQEEIHKIIKGQRPEEEKLKLADKVIYNDDTQSVILQVLETHKLLLARSRAQQ